MKPIFVLHNRVLWQRQKCDQRLFGWNTRLPQAGIKFSLNFFLHCALKVNLLEAQKLTHVSEGHTNSATHLSDVAAGSRKSTRLFDTDKDFLWGGVSFWLVTSVWSENVSIINFFKTNRDFSAWSNWSHSTGVTNAIYAFIPVQRKTDKMPCGYTCDGHPILWCVVCMFVTFVTHA